jgi:putative ABC transport system ATP-binding protein/lipoprotein-releasing system ATP-binding protein
MPEALVEAYDVVRTYRIGDQTVVAVQDATCRVDAGARIALQGPSGSGKSTLLQMLGGIEELTSGSIRWPALGEREELRPRHIAFVFQRSSLLAPLTVIENLEVPLVLQDASHEEARARSLEALNLFGLSDLADKLPEELSGGQSQRVAFARAVAMRTELILADEPTGQLDTQTAEEFLNTALRVLDAQGTTLLVATHDERVAKRMQTRWHMSHGKLETAA